VRKEIGEPSREGTKRASSGTYDQRPKGDHKIPLVRFIVSEREKGLQRAPVKKVSL